MKNILVNNENIVRALEIAQTGGFKVAILFQEDVSELFKGELLKTLSEFVTITSPKYADLVLEYCIPDSNSALKVTETRIEKFERANYEIVSNKLDSTANALLDVAYRKLNFDLMDKEIVIAVARCIAFIGNSQSIKTEHLAEAIHYRAFDRNLIKDDRSWTAKELSDILNVMAYDKTKPSNFVLAVLELRDHLNLD